MIISHVQFVREALIAILRSNDETKAFAAFSRETVDTAALMFRPSLVVVDGLHPEGMALITAARVHVPTVKVVVLARCEQDINFLTWADRGIDGYLGPDMSAHELLSTMRRVVASDIVCPPRQTTLFFNHVAGRTDVRTTEAGIFDLTTREREIAELLADGLSNIQIAHQLHLARSTVKNHVHSILEKWDVRNRGEAAARYHREMHCNLESSSQESAGLHSNVQPHQLSQV